MVVGGLVVSGTVLVTSGVEVGGMVLGTTPSVCPGTVVGGRVKSGTVDASQSERNQVILAFLCM